MNDEPNPVGRLPEGVKGVSMSHVTEVLSHHLQDLISRAETTVLVGSTLFVNLFKIVQD